MAVERLTFEMNAVGNAVPEMKKVQNQLRNVDRTIQRSTRSFSRSGGALRGMTRNLGLVGLQVQDVAVQASMGTDALRIFSMQGPQVLSIFGPLGMIAGALGGVGAGLLMANGGLQRFGGVFEQIRPSLDNFIAAMGVLIQQFEPLTTMVGNTLTGAFRVMGIMVNFVTDNIAALSAAVGIFIAIQLTQVLYTAAVNFVALARAISAARIMMVAFNLVTRRSPLGVLAVIIGVAADQMGLITAAMERLREEFPEFFSAVDDAASTLAQTIRASYQAIDDAFSQPIELDIEGNAGSTLEQLRETSRSVTNEMRDRISSAAKMIDGSMENAFMSVIDGTKTVKDAFRSMAAEIIKELYRIFVVKRITGFIAGAIENFFMPAMQISGPAGASATMPVPRPSFAGGGYTGMGSRSGGVDGRGGFNAILHPNETVIDHNRGGGMGTVIVNQTINVSTGVQQTVRTEIKQLMPQIAESAKQAVVDAKRRGGSYGRAFA
jgi:hypothetical protein